MSSDYDDAMMASPSVTPEQAVIMREDRRLSTRPAPWGHRRAGAIYVVQFQSALARRMGSVKLYHRWAPGSDQQLVDEICCGERYAHVAPGLLFSHEHYHGSYLDNWHGGPQSSLTDIIRWLAEAEHPEWGYEMWMIRDGELIHER